MEISILDIQGAEIPGDVASRLAPLLPNSVAQLLDGGAKPSDVLYVAFRKSPISKINEFSDRFALLGFAKAMPFLSDVDTVHAFLADHSTGGGTGALMAVRAAGICAEAADAISLATAKGDAEAVTAIEAIWHAADPSVDYPPSVDTLEGAAQIIKDVFA